MAKPNQPSTNLVNTDGTVAVALAPVQPIYGECELSRPDNAQVYPAQRGGGRSTVAINVKLPVIAAGLVIASTVYARFNPETSKVTFEAALPKGVAAKDEARDTFKSHVNAAIMAWPGRDRAFSEAYDKLTNPDAGKAKAGSKAASAAPIVWAPPVVTAAPAPAAPVEGAPAA